MIYLFVTYAYVMLIRQQFLTMEKAQMAVQFEERESARRLVDWQRRGVPTMQERPRPKGLTLMSNQLEVAK